MLIGQMAALTAVGSVGLQDILSAPRATSDPVVCSEAWKVVLGRMYFGEP
jgi:hypothetical protein